MAVSFAQWQLETSAALARLDIDPAAIHHRHWRHAFIIGLAPAEAADKLATGHVNAMPHKKRLAYLKGRELLAALSPEDRDLVRDVMQQHTTLTVAEAIEALQLFGGL